MHGTSYGGRVTAAPADSAAEEGSLEQGTEAPPTARLTGVC